MQSNLLRFLLKIENEQESSPVTLPHHHFHSLRGINPLPEGFQHTGKGQQPLHAVSGKCAAQMEHLPFLICSSGQSRLTAIVAGLINCQHLCPLERCENVVEYRCFQTILIPERKALLLIWACEREITDIGACQLLKESRLGQHHTFTAQILIAAAAAHDESSAPGHILLKKRRALFAEHDRMRVNGNRISGQFRKVRLVFQIDNVIR